MASDAPSAASAASSGGQAKAGDVRSEKTIDKKTEGLDESATDMDRTIFRTLEMLSKVSLPGGRERLGSFFGESLHVYEFRSLKGLYWDTEGVRRFLQFALCCMGSSAERGRNGGARSGGDGGRRRRYYATDDGGVRKNGRERGKPGLWSTDNPP